VVAKPLAIDLTPDELQQIKAIIGKHLFGKKIWAYGSRVKGRSGCFSDLDLVVFAASVDEVEEAREVFVESDLPFSVDLLSWESLPEDFQRNIESGYVVLWSCLAS